MEWVERMNAAMDDLEKHFTEPVNCARLGRIACCSAYHFQRMFGYLAGIPLSEYVRRRRMSLALTDLQAGMKVADAAAKYGYDSPTAFNRAFQSVHGFPPSRAGEPGRVLKSFPPIRFCITVKGATVMEYRIEEKAAFRIVGRSIPLDSEIEKNFAAVPGFWARAAQDGTIPQLCGRMDGTVPGVLGISTCNDREEWRYYIAVTSSAPAEEMEEYTVPAFTWAVFPGRGTAQSVQELERRIVGEWLPASGYEYADGPDVEVYLDPDPEDARYEVWIPVVKIK